MINYTDSDFLEEVRRLTDGAGVEVVYDGVGAATYERSFDSLKPRGLLALYGASSGPVPPLNAQILNAKGSLYLTRPSLGHYTLTRDELGVARGRRPVLDRGWRTGAQDRPRSPAGPGRRRPPRPAGPRNQRQGVADSLSANPPESDADLRRRIDFLLELDQAKGVLRRSFITAEQRRENDAEHAWHVTMFALVLADYAPPEADIARVIAMLLVHDIVEIDAGDAFLYDEEARAPAARP